MSVLAFRRRESSLEQQLLDATRDGEAKWTREYLSVGTYRYERDWMYIVEIDLATDTIAVNGEARPMSSRAASQLRWAVIKSAYPKATTGEMLRLSI